MLAIHFAEWESKLDFRSLFSSPNSCLAPEAIRGAGYFVYFPCCLAHERSPTRKRVREKTAREGTTTMVYCMVSAFSKSCACVYWACMLCYVPTVRLFCAAFVLAVCVLDVRNGFLFCAAARANKVWNFLIHSHQAWVLLIPVAETRITLTVSNAPQ